MKAMCSPTCTSLQHTDSLLLGVFVAFRYAFPHVGSCPQCVLTFNWSLQMSERLRWHGSNTLYLRVKRVYPIGDTVAWYQALYKH